MKMEMRLIIVTTYVAALPVWAQVAASPATVNRGTSAAEVQNNPMPERALPGVAANTTMDPFAGETAAMAMGQPRVSVSPYWQANFTGVGVNGIGSVSLIRFGEADAKTAAELTEDLSILSYLLGRNLERAFAADVSDYKLGIPMLFTSSGKSVNATYIQGFGVILTMRVRFPLMSVVTDKEQAESGRDHKKDSAWDEARRSLLGGGTTEPRPGSLGIDWQRNPDAIQEYNPKFVDILRNRILSLLKNASNVRHLEGQDSIVVKIVGSPILVSENVAGLGGAKEGQSANDENGEAGQTGSAERPRGQSGIVRTHRGLGGNLRFSSGIGGAGAGIGGEPMDNTAQTVMTIRVKKSSVDAFSGGSLSEEQFQKEAEVTTYLQPSLSATLEAAETSYRAK